MNKKYASVDFKTFDKVITEREINTYNKHQYCHVEVINNDRVSNHERTKNQYGYLYYVLHLF